MMQVSERFQTQWEQMQQSKWEMFEEICDKLLKNSEEIFFKIWRKIFKVHIFERK